MLQNHKQYCAALAPQGYVYTGFDDGFYVFQTGDYAKGFKELRAIEDDLTLENLAFMAKHNLTR